MPRIKKPIIPHLPKCVQTGEKFGFKIGDKVKVNCQKYDRFNTPPILDRRFVAPIEGKIGIVAGFPEDSNCLTIYYEGLGFAGYYGFNTYSIHHTVWDKI